MSFDLHGDHRDEYEALVEELQVMPAWHDAEGRMYLPPKQRKQGETERKVTIHDLLGRFRTGPMLWFWRIGPAWRAGGDSAGQPPDGLFARGRQATDAVVGDGSSQRGEGQPRIPG